VKRSYRALAVGFAATSLVTGAGFALAAAPPTPAELSGSHPVAADQTLDRARLRSPLADIGATADGLLRQVELLQQELVDPSPTPAVATSGPPASTGRPAPTPATTVAAHPTTAGAGPSSVATTATPTSPSPTPTRTATPTQSTTSPRPTRSGGDDD
jgi:hypothetical protein